MLGRRYQVFIEGGFNGMIEMVVEALSPKVGRIWVEWASWGVTSWAISLGFGRHPYSASMDYGFIVVRG